MVEAETSRILAKVFNRLGLTEANRLGEGGEAWIYTLGTDQVLRIHKPKPDNIDYIERQRRFYDFVHGRLSVRTPLISEIIVVEDVICTIQSRIPGEALDRKFCELRAADKARVLSNYVKLALELKSFPVSEELYGHVFADHSLRTTDWHSFLHGSIDRKLAEKEAALLQDGFDPRAVGERLCAKASAQPDCHKPQLVHGDYWPGNIMINETMEITGLLDFGPMTIYGDPLMDLASSCIWLEVVDGYMPEDSSQLTKLYTEAGYALGIQIDFYNAYFALQYYDCDGWPALQERYQNNLQSLLQSKS